MINLTLTLSVYLKTILKLYEKEGFIELNKFIVDNFIVLISMIPREAPSAAFKQFDTFTSLTPCNKVKPLKSGVSCLSW